MPGRPSAVALLLIIARCWQRVSSESSKLVRASQSDPKINAVATGSKRGSAGSGRKGANRSQVRRLPQGDTLSIQISDQDALAVKGGLERTIQPVGGQRG